MELSKDPKCVLLVNTFLKEYRIIGLLTTIVGVIAFCLFNKGSKKVSIDSNMFTEFAGNSILKEENKLYMQKVEDYFRSYSYGTDISIIDVLENYVKEKHPFIETEKHKISNDKNIDDTIFIATTHCKFCNNLENLIVVINFDFKERKYFHSLSVALTLMDHFSNCDYLSKDIIFVFTNKELLYAAGIAGFIEHHFYVNSLKRNSLTRGAVIIEFDSVHPSYVRLIYEGLNGLLANQDFIALLLHQLNHYGIPVKTNSVFESVFNMALEKEYESGHTHFLRENVAAFTIRGSNQLNIKDKMLNLFFFTQSLESFLRSMSNTHEGLVHSTSFYFFDTIKRYVPISIYSAIVYLICGFCFLKLLKSRVILNFLNFIIGITLYIINTLILALPLYLVSTNKKVSHFLKNKYTVPECSEWHPEQFEKYVKITETWVNIFLISIITTILLNYVVSRIINHIHKRQKYKKVEKIERLILLVEIRKLNKKKNILYEEYMNGNKKCFENGNIEKNRDYKCSEYNNEYNNVDVIHSEKPKVVDSDDENFLMEKKNFQIIKDIEKEIEKKHKKLQLLKNENTKYIMNQSLASYSLIMKYANIIYFVFVVVSTSLYNWSLATLFALVFIAPVSLQYKLTNKSKKIFRKIFLLLFILLLLVYTSPYEDAITNGRRKLNQFLFSHLKNCRRFIQSSKITKLEHFPTEFLSFVCSSKWFKSLYLEKYFLRDKIMKSNYKGIVQNEVLLNIYTLARNYICIGTITYPFWCFAVVPIFFHIAFIFFF